MQEQETLFEPKLNGDAVYQFKELSKWIKLFVTLSLLSVMMIILFVAFKFNRIIQLINKDEVIVERTVLMVAMIVGGLFILGFAAVMLFFLGRSGRRLRMGLEKSNQEEFNSGLNDLKTFFVIWGAWGILSLMGVLMTLL